MKLEQLKVLWYWFDERIPFAQEEEGKEEEEEEEENKKIGWQEVKEQVKGSDANDSWVSWLLRWLAGSATCCENSSGNVGGASQKIEIHAVPASDGRSIETITSPTSA